jgi:hypothetical protein
MWGIDYEIMSAQNIHGQSNVNTHHCVISFGPILELIAIGARGGFWNTRNRITSVSYHDFERSESKLPYMCPGYSNHMYNQQWGRIAHNVTITELSEYISYIMNPGSEQDYRAHNITTFVLSVARMASTDTDRGRGLPSLLPRQCQLRTMLRSRCPSLMSRNHCHNKSASSSELSKYPLCLPVGCGDSGSPSKRQAGGRSSPEKDSYYETLLLWRSVGPFKKSWKHPSSPEGRLHRWSSLGHGVRSSSSSLVPTKLRLPLSQHKSHEGWDNRACQPPSVRWKPPQCRWNPCTLA